LQNIKVNKNDYQNIINHYKKFNLPKNIKNFFFKKKIYKILSFMQKDKKNKNSKINLILLKNIGNVDYNYYFKSSKIYKFLNKELIN